MVAAALAAVPGAVPPGLWSFCRHSGDSWMWWSRGPCAPEAPLEPQGRAWWLFSSLIPGCLPHFLAGAQRFPPPPSSPVLVTVVYRGPGGSSVFLLSFGSPSPKLLCPLHSGLLKGTCRGTWNLCSHCLTGVSPSTACRCLGPV